MNSLRILRARWCLIGLLALFALILLTPQVTTAQGPVVDKRPLPEAQPPGVLAPTTTANLSRFLKVNLKGGYVAHGVGLMSTGSGDIVVSDIPRGATVQYAYLIWNVYAPTKLTSHGQGKFNGRAIKGTFVSSNWSAYFYEARDRTWTYRASVKPYVTGNGTFKLSGFAHDATWRGAMGATLVIIYSKSNYPLTLIQVYSGTAPSHYNAPSTLRLQATGIGANAPTGFAKATFIGSDSFGGSSTVTTFNTKALPSVTFGASDGSYWNTTTVDLTDLVEPDDLAFTFSTNVPGGAVWVGQVVSYSSGVQDTDRDGLRDGWELHGYRDVVNRLLVDLPAMGADPMHKDLFVEMDYMPNSATTNHLPDKFALDDIVAVFNNAPVGNPDGTTGIHIHLDTGGADGLSAPGTFPEYNLGGGNSITHQEHLGVNTAGCATYDWGQFQVLKNANFNWYRTHIFHYVIFAHDLSPCFGSVSGFSRNGSPDAVFIKGATDFIVSLGSWTNEGYLDYREGTFIHELGHNLGLRHGGNDHKNFKPNYLSVMNYLFQVSGVYRDGSWWHYDYSRFTVPPLNELALNENTGLGPLATNYGTTWFCSDGVYVSDTSAGSNIDWNCDGDSTDARAKANINYDTSCNPDYCPAYTTLSSQNNWANITFKGGGRIGTALTGGVASADGPAVTTWVNELSFDQHQKLMSSNHFPAHR